MNFQPIAPQLHYDEKCIICGENVPGESIGRVREHEYENTVSGDFPVFQCRNCGLVYLWPRPDVSVMPLIYPSNYYSYHVSHNTPIAGTTRKSFVESLIFQLSRRRLLASISKTWTCQEVDRPVRVLDVGCGVGGQLDMAASIFDKCETYGVEIDELAVRKARARGHTVYHSRFEDAELPNRFFDIVFAFHLIEHVARPDFFLRKCLNVLSDQGIVCIETPNTDCLEFNLFKEKHWGGYHAPRHWYLFQPRTFRVLASRFNSRITYWEFRFIPTYWSWTFHSLLMDFVGKRIADIIFPPIKICFGGLQSFIILSFFAVMGRVLTKLTGKGNAVWIVISKDSARNVADPPEGWGQ
jgi:SAM-dependent methyltransferase